MTDIEQLRAALTEADRLIEDLLAYPVADWPKSSILGIALTNHRARRAAAHEKEMAEWRARVGIT